MQADNATRSFKCESCGNMFSTRETRSICPVCGFNCLVANCEVLEASDEGY